MTSKEALELLKGAGANLIEPYNSQVIEIFIKLVERDTPKKVVFTDRWTLPKCPNCQEQECTIYNGYGDDYELNFCNGCGQRLDWNDEDETLQR